MPAVALVESVKGTPSAAAARAMPTSTPGQAMPAPPVGATKNGCFEGPPRISQAGSTFATSTSTRGSRRARSKASRLSRSVISSSAPPSMKSKMARGRRRRAIPRRSAIE